MEYKPKYLWLHVTTKCNLSCKYCYASVSPKIMCEKIAFQAIDYFIEHAPDNEELWAYYYGGEPLLNWDLIEKTVKYVKSKNKNVKFGIQTNATLINKFFAEKLKKYNFKVGVSIDGTSKFHDKNRIFANGLGSYDMVVKGIKVLIASGVKVYAICVVTQYNVEHLHNLVSHFISLGLSSINFLPVKDANQVDPQKFAEKLIEAQNIVESKNTDFFIKNIKSIKNKLTSKIIEPPCGAINSNMLVMPDGQVYNCPFLLKTKYSIGKLPNFNPEKSHVLKLFQDWFTKVKKECANCKLLTVCSGGCPIDKLKLTKAGCWSSCSFYKPLFENKEVSKWTLAQQ